MSSATTRKLVTLRIPVMHQGLPIHHFAFYEVDGDEIHTESGRKLRNPFGKPGAIRNIKGVRYTIESTGVETNEETLERFWVAEAKAKEGHHA